MTEKEERGRYFENMNFLKLHRQLKNTPLDTGGKYAVVIADLISDSAANIKNRVLKNLNQN
jgi:hypothetical protein